MNRRPHAVRALALLTLLFACGPAAQSQEKDAPRLEVGVQFTSLAVNLPNPVFGFPVISPGDPGTDPEAGFGARLTYNLSDHVGLEAEGNFFPREHFPGTRTPSPSTSSRTSARLTSRRTWAASSRCTPRAAS